MPKPIKHPPIPMTGTDMKAIRLDLKATQAELAAMLGPRRQSNPARENCARTSGHP